MPVMRILVVEDDPQDAFLLTRELRHLWPESTVLLAQSCTRGLELLAEQRDEIDMLISDLGLPDTDGLETVRRLLGAAETTPLIILTGSDDDALAREAVVLGAQDFLRKKEILSPRLQNAVQNALARSERELLIKQAAMTDPLTRMLNRAGLQAALERTLQEEAEEVVVLLLDLDRFKIVNDTHGHAAGDLLLQHVSERILDAVRPGDRVARLGGDEFTVVLTRLSDTDVQCVAARLVQDLEEDYRLSEQICVRIGASIGIARGRVDDTPQELMERADAEMYATKRRRVQEHSTGSVSVLCAANGTRQAMSIHPSPTGRWSHAVVQHWLTQAVADASTTGLRVLLYLPAEALLIPDLPQLAAALLAARRLPPETLCLMLEGIDTDQEAPLQSPLSTIRQHGIQLGLADLGGTRCGLARLLTLQPCTVALAGELLQTCLEQPAGTALLEGVVQLCQDLGAEVVLPVGLSPVMIRWLQRHAAVLVAQPIQHTQGACGAAQTHGGLSAHCRR